MYINNLKRFQFFFLTLCTIIIWHGSYANQIFEKDNEYLIQGTIFGLKFGTVYIRHFDENGKTIKTDSSKVDNEKFEFKGQLLYPEHVKIGLRKTNAKGEMTYILFDADIILDYGNLKIEAHKDSLSKLIASGTKGQDEFNVFKKKTDAVFILMNQIRGEKQIAERNKNKKLLDSLDRAYQYHQNRVNSLVVEHIKSYPSSYISPYIAVSYLSYPDNILVKSLFNSFDEKIKNSFYGKQLYKLLLTSNRTANGVLAPQFILPDINNKLITLESFKGKYVLIDFWASWCGPCREENPNLIRNYNQYKNKNFEIIGISGDKNRQEWIKAIKTDKLPWINVSDLKGAKSEVAISYGITTIPTNFLLDKEGKIIGRNLRGQDLINALAKLKW